MKADELYDEDFYGVDDEGLQEVFESIVILADDILSWESLVASGADQFDTLVYYRSICEYNRDRLTAEEQAQLDWVDNLWRENAADFNKAMRYEHTKEGRENYENPPHWWWWPIKQAE